MLGAIGRPVTLPAPPHLVGGALKHVARVVRGHPADVGAGLVTLVLAREFVSRLTPSRALAALGLDEEVIALVRPLDAELGPLWIDERLQIVDDVFGTGVRFSVARVLG